MLFTYQEMYQNMQFVVPRPACLKSNSMLNSKHQETVSLNVGKSSEQILTLDKQLIVNIEDDLSLLSYTLTWYNPNIFLNPIHTPWVFTICLVFNLWTYVLYQMLCFDTPPAWHWPVHPLTTSCPSGYRSTAIFWQCCTITVPRQASWHLAFWVSAALSLILCLLIMYMCHYGSNIWGQIF